LDYQRHEARRQLVQTLDGADQPAPVATTGPAIWDLVIDDMHARDRVGRQRYGVPLQANNGRNSIRDAYEEALDLVVYLRQHMAEAETAKNTAVVALSAEVERLRNLVDEFADMDIAEPEIEHREIIDRCRQEQQRWA
jgi:hypothetical protein